MGPLNSIISMGSMAEAQWLYIIVKIHPELKVISLIHVFLMSLSFMPIFYSFTIFLMLAKTNTNIAKWLINTNRIKEKQIIIQLSLRENNKAIKALFH